LLSVSEDADWRRWLLTDVYRVAVTEVTVEEMI
jgi:hypothetical protein